MQLASLSGSAVFPENLTVTAISSTSVMVTWDIALLPYDYNISAFEVFYQPLESFHGILQTNSVNVSGSEMLVILMDLEEFVTYNISVLVYATTGMAHTDGVMVTTLEDSKLF